MAAALGQRSSRYREPCGACQPRQSAQIPIALTGRPRYRTSCRAPCDPWGWRPWASAESPGRRWTSGSACGNHARHRPTVAPPPGEQEVDLPTPDGTPAGQRRDRRDHRAARHREQRLGIPAHPRRATQTQPPGQRIHDRPGPQGTADPAGAETAYRYDLAAVPARASRDHARRRLLPRGLRSDPPAAVLPVRHRGRLPLRAHPRGHRPPGPTLDYYPADPQPPDRPRRPRRRLPVPGSRFAAAPGSSPHPPARS